MVLLLQRSAYVHTSPWEVTPSPDNYDVIAHQTGPVAPGATVTYRSDAGPLSGRYLVIQILGKEYLTLCEVTVSGVLGKNIRCSFK